MQLDLAFAALLQLVTTPELVLLMLLAVPVGLFFGAVPGLGGKLGLVILIPFVFGMEPLAGAVLLLAMHAVVHTGAAIPSILFGVPGMHAPDARNPGHGPKEIGKGLPLGLIRVHGLPQQCDLRYAGIGNARYFP